MTETPDLSHLDLRPLPGSERPAYPSHDAAAAHTAIDSDATITVTLVLRRRAELPATAVVSSGAELAAQYGADPADLELVTSTLSQLGARIIEADAPSRRVRISGSVALLSAVFGTRLSGENSDVSGRYRSGGLSVPARLDGIVTAVLGLDDRPQGQALFRVAPAAEVNASFTPVELGAIYNFPEKTDGSGQTVAIIELGGGFGQADLDAYFAELKLSSPKVTAVGVDGAENRPGQDPNGADGEVLLDIEVVGALAPKADIVVYFAPNTDAGFLDAVAQAAHATPTPVAISISWGQSEDQWTKQARTAMDDAFADACALGVTVTAAAGDNGSADAQTDGKVHVDFPAASPHALACGGTSLHTSAHATTETVWNNGSGRGATGGGISDTFPRPAWQSHAGVESIKGKSGRGVPDVAAVADPATGYRVRVDGSDLVIGGTSAVAPLWAALVARLVQATGQPLGQLQPTLYATAAPGTVPPGFRDITEGNNGQYSAAPGWDACTGLGVPDGAKLLAALSKSASA